MSDKTIDKLKANFDGMIVKKSSLQNVFASLSLPAFIRDWFLKKYADKDGCVNVNFVLEKIKDVMPRKNEWNAILDKLLSGERVRFLTKLSVSIDIKTKKYTFSLPDFGITDKETYISQSVWEKHKKALLVTDGEFWGIVDLEYLNIDNGKKTEGKIALVDFKDFRPYKIDLDFYKAARKNFELDEWIDVLLGAIDYNANGFKSELNKLTMLSRLLPFVEKRLNLIELAPKGTGKSYLFGNVSRFGWLSSGGIMSRSKMFYDQSKRREGLIAGSDYVTLDEVQTISFTDTDEMRAALKGYMEQGNFTVGDYKGVADAGVVLCGNISKKIMDADGYENMFVELPVVFHESALIERFHGFIKGWNIPRMNDDLKVNGWALNSEYFCSILHEMRNDMTYRNIVDELIIVPEGADTRDTEAVKRISTAYLKLLFPHVQDASEIAPRDFKRYCFERARKMRQTIKFQVGILDEEYRGKDMPAFKIKGLGDV